MCIRPKLRAFGAPSPSTKSEPLKAARETFWSAGPGSGAELSPPREAPARARKNAPDLAGNQIRSNDS